MGRSVHSGLAIAFGIIVAALGFLVVPSPYLVIYGPVAGVLLALAIITALRNPRRVALGTSHSGSDLSTDRVADELSDLPYRVDTITDLSDRYSRLRISLPVAVPFAFVIRRCGNALLTDRIVRNTLLGAGGFEYELRPLMAGRDEVDAVVSIAASHREFLKAFLQPEMMEAVMAYFSAESVYLVDLACSGDAVCFIFQPEFETLPAGTASQLLARYEWFVRQLTLAIISNAQLFSS